MKFGEYEVPDDWTIKDLADYLKKINKLQDFKYIFRKRKTAQEILDEVKNKN